MQEYAWANWVHTGVTGCVGLLAIVLCLYATFRYRSAGAGVLALWAGFQTFAFLVHQYVILAPSFRENRSPEDFYRILTFYSLATRVIGEGLFLIAVALLVYDMHRWKRAAEKAAARVAASPAS